MKRLIRTSLALSAATILTVLSAPAMRAQMAPKAEPPAAKHKMVPGDDIKWGPAPPSLPPGAQAAVLDGDPSQPGLFAIRLKFPAGYSVAPHWHPTDEHVTVLSGSLRMGMGDTVDDASMHALKAHAYKKMPAKASHYVKVPVETVIQVMAMGPFEVTYVDPMNDPRKK